MKYPKGPTLKKMGFNFFYIITLPNRSVLHVP